MRKAFVITIIFLLPVLFSYRQEERADHATQIDDWYALQLSLLKKETVAFDELLITASSITTIKEHFRKMRWAYKKMAVLTDYFNVYETISLNGPALSRTEEDHPENIIPPHGFQELEDIIWNEDKLSDKYSELRFESAFVLAMIDRLEKEPDRLYKFKNDAVWNALRMQVISILTKGITGFDSPAAFYSLPEAIASLEGMEEIVELYADDHQKQFDSIYKSIDEIIAASKNYLRAHYDFNQFDRLVFIKDYLNPLSEELMKATQAQGYTLPSERRPLNDAAKNVFSPDAFDVDFFSPNIRYQATPARVALGQKLFYDNRLSLGNTRSCASCHQPALAFTDGLQTAAALDNSHALIRNTPTLLNAVYQTRQFYDSRKTMLEFQIASVVHNAAEMGGSIEETARLLRQDPSYQAVFQSAYPADAEAVSIHTITNAIASYVRSLQSLDSRFDQYMRNEKVTLTDEEKFGFNVFTGKAKCATCHFIPLFNGLVPPQFNETESEVLGVPFGVKKPYKLDTDSGKYYFTHSPVHLYAFKTPSIRNVALTAPYMHNGVYKTLEEVVDFYNEGGGKGLGIAPPNQTLPFDKLDLSKKEKKAIVAFMKTLTDTSSYKRWQHGN